MALTAKHFYDFENFRIDPDERVLLCEGRPLPLTPKAFQMLLILVENRGHIVEKEKLMDEIWTDSFVEEGSLSVNARRLRMALRDDASHPKFIETIPRRGYRFIAPVKETNDVGGENGGEPIVDQLDTSPRAASAMRYLPLAAAGLLIGAALIYYFGFAEAPAAGDRRSIAVLPIKPINTASRDELYELGIAESLINRLSSMKGFVVRPLSATRDYTDLTQDPLEAGREQKVDYVLAANYQFADNKVRVTAQLFDTATGGIEDTYKSEFDTGDFFAMQDAIAADLGNQLIARFAATSASPIARSGTTNEEAYRLYLQGMYLSNNRLAPDARKAVETLERAVQLDPNYALAWAAKAYAHRAAGNYERVVDTRDAYRRSMEAIDRALALDPNLSQAYTALCENKMYYEYDFEGAEKACRKAIELEPNSPLAHQVYSRVLPGRRRLDESIAEVKLAIELEPASLFYQRLYGHLLHYARRYDEAAAQYKRILAMDENNVNGYVWLIDTLSFQGKEAEAFEWFIRYLNSRRTDEQIVRAYGSAFQAGGWNGVLHEQAKRFEESDDVYFRAAGIHAQIGNKDKAFEYLERSYQRRELWMFYLHVHPLVDNLRGDPRLDDLIERVESH